MREVARCIERIRSAPLGERTTLVPTMIKDGDGQHAVLCDLVVYRTSPDQAAVGLLLADGSTRRLTPKAISTADAATCAAMQIVTARAMYGDAELLLVWDKLTT